MAQLIQLVRTIGKATLIVCLFVFADYMNVSVHDPFFSLFNSEEIDMVLKYVNVLLQTKKCKRTLTELDIGIVTPYKMQAEEIQERCKLAFLTEITVGTAAVLQGQEKPVIIISTVSMGNVSEFAANFRVTSFK